MSYLLFIILTGYIKVYLCRDTFKYLLFVNYLLLIPYYLFLITYYPLPITHYLLPITYYLFFIPQKVVGRDEFCIKFYRYF